MFAKITILIVLMLPNISLLAQNFSGADQEDQVIKGLNQVETKQMYLRQLNNLQEAVARELSIVKLMRECGQLDATCTGQGMLFKSPESELKPTRPVAAEVIEAIEVPNYELPTLLSVYQSTAVIKHENRQLEVTEGQEVGLFRVGRVGLKSVQLLTPKGVSHIYLQWNVEPKKELSNG